MATRDLNHNHTLAWSSFSLLVGSRKTSTFRISFDSAGTDFPERKFISTTLSLGDYLSISRARIWSYLLIYSSSTYFHPRSHHKHFQTSQTIQPSHNFGSVRTINEIMSPCTCTKCSACSGDCSSCGCADCGVSSPYFPYLAPNVTETNAYSSGWRSHTI